MVDLIALERRLWLEGGPAFEALLAPEAVSVVPMEGGILDRSQTLATIREAPRWDDVSLSGVGSHTHPGESTMLYYTATAVRGEVTWRAHCSSLWIVDDGEHRLLHHQQTPIS